MGVQPVGAAEELDPARPLHVLIGDQQRDGIAVLGEGGEPGEAGGGAVGRDDQGVVAEPAAEVAFERVEHRRVGRDEEDDRLDHGAIERIGGRCQVYRWCDEHEEDSFDL